MTICAIKIFIIYTVHRETHFKNLMQRITYKITPNKLFNFMNSPQNPDQSFRVKILLPIHDSITKSVPTMYFIIFTGMNSGSFVLRSVKSNVSFDLDFREISALMVTIRH